MPRSRCARLANCTSGSMPSFDGSGLDHSTSIPSESLFPLRPVMRRAYARIGGGLQGSFFP